MEAINENVVEQFRQQFESRRDYLTKEISTHQIELSSINRVLNALDGKEEGKANKTGVNWINEVPKVVATFEHGKQVTIKDIKEGLRQRLGHVVDGVNLTSAIAQYAGKKKMLIEQVKNGGLKTFLVNKV